MSEDLQAIVNKELNLLKESSNALQYSYDICNEIGIKENYSEKELESFEALCSRFARLTDIIIQKALKTIDMIDLETPGTVRDRINRAYQKNIISNADKLIDARVLRNDIAHEYLPEAFRDIFKSVMGFSPLLLEDIKKINEYCKTKYKL